MRILFFDTVCPAPYDPVTLESIAQGGTESTVTRIAEALAKSGHTVDVAQKGRQHPGRWNAHYVSLEELQSEYDAVVVLRDPRPLVWAHRKFPEARFFLWAHDENYDLLLEAGDLIRETNTTVIGVSRYHQSMLYNAFLTELPKKLPKVEFIYNPIADVEPRKQVPSELRFLYFSSPHKGLELTLDQFKRIRERETEATLYVANPGYYESKSDLKSPGVNVLGTLSHPRLLEELGRAWAVLHCNSVFPETFGLVHAESNGLGVPVITGGFGANREVLDPYGDQCFDITKPEQILAKVEQWKKQYPVVRGKPQFKLSAVLREWEKLLK